MNRPKQGFSLPLGAWLRGELRDTARERILQAIAGGQVDACDEIGQNIFLGNTAC